MTSTPDTTLIRDRAFLQRVALYFTKKAGFPVSLLVAPVHDPLGNWLPGAHSICAKLSRPEGATMHPIKAVTPVAFITELDTLLNTKTKDNHREQLLNKNSDLG